MLSEPHPLSDAVREDSLSNIELIFASGGDAHHGKPMHHAIKRQPLDTHVLDLLLEKGSPRDKIQFESNEQTETEYQMSAMALGTPLQMAIADNNPVAFQYLIDRGASRLRRDLKNRTTYQVALETDACSKIVALVRE